MASYSQKMFFIALVVAIAVPSSIGRRENWRESEDTYDTEQYLRDLCSETDKSDVCWYIMKSELHRFDDLDDKDIAASMIDLAMGKSEKIQDQLNQWYKDSQDDKLKKKYHSCSKSYNEVNHNLKKAKKNLDSDEYPKISNKIDDAKKKLDKCIREFESDSVDPGHVGDRNNELGLYLDMVEAATRDLEDYYKEDRH